MAAYKKEEDASARLQRQLRAEQMPCGCFFLCGEEEYLKRYYLERLRDRLVPDESARMFDHIRLRGSDKTEEPLLRRLERAFASLPVCGPVKLVELSEPMLREMRRTELDAFCTLLSDIMQQQDTAFVMLLSEEELPTQDYRALQSPLWKALCAVCTPYVFSLQPREKLIPWCRRHFQKQGIEADVQTVTMLLDRVGRHMDALDGEIGKVCAYVKATGNKEATPQLVQFICPYNLQGQAFGLSDAILRRRVDQAFMEYRLARRDRADEIQIFAQVLGVLLDLHRVACAVADGYAPAQIAKMFHMKPGRVAILQRGLVNYRIEELQELVSYAAKIDYQMKYTMLPKQLLLERMLCAIAPGNGATT